MPLAVPEIFFIPVLLTLMIHITAKSRLLNTARALLVCPHFHCLFLSVVVCLHARGPHHACHDVVSSSSLFNLYFSEIFHFERRNLESISKQKYMIISFSLLCDSKKGGPVVTLLIKQFKTILITVIFLAQILPFQPMRICYGSI